MAAVALTHSCPSLPQRVAAVVAAVVAAAAYQPQPVLAFSLPPLPRLVVAAARCSCVGVLVAASDVLVSSRLVAAVAGSSSSCVGVLVAASDRLVAAVVGCSSSCVGVLVAA